MAGWIQIIWIQFKFYFRLFDKDDDGLLSVAELRNIMTSLGDKMTNKEANAMVKEVDAEKDGFINCKGT